MGLYIKKQRLFHLAFLPVKKGTAFCFLLYHLVHDFRSHKKGATAHDFTCGFKSHQSEAFT